MPPLKQVQLGKLPDQTKLRGHCDEIVGLVEKVLSSPIWNIDLNFVATIECMNEDCKKPIRKRDPVGKDTVEVQCFECKAEYIITWEEGTASAGGIWGQIASAIIWMAPHGHSWAQMPQPLQ